MKIIEKDILTVESGIIVQQVNCQGKMNSGLAKAIRDKWPVVYEDYINSYNTEKSWPFDLLGHIKITGILKDLYVCNIFGQLNFGYDGKRYTDYCALNEAFKELFNRAGYYDRQVYFPERFGCDRGGADWNIVGKMIDYYFPNAIICKLPEK